MGCGIELVAGAPGLDAPIGSSVRDERRARHRALQVAVELQPVAVRVAYVELAGAPSRVGDGSAVGQLAELVRQPIDVVHRESENGPTASDSDEVMPLQSKHSVVSTDEHEPRRIGIVTKQLHEPETGIEHRGSRDVADTQHGFDALDYRRHARILPGLVRAVDALAGPRMRVRYGDSTIGRLNTSAESGAAEAVINWLSASAMARSRSSVACW